MDLMYALYLIDLLGGLQLFFGILSILFFSFAFFKYIVCKEDQKEIEFKNFKSLLICLFVSLFICLFLPTKKTMYMMFGVHLGNTVVNTKEFNSVTKRVFNIVDKKLKEFEDEK